VIDLLNSATAVSFDPAGVVTVDGVAKTIDSPLENLAIYVALMATGTIHGVDSPALGNLFLVDGVKTAEDLAAATTFLAAATDKWGAPSRPTSSRTSISSSASTPRPSKARV
jgi:hypothetical protein